MRFAGDAPALHPGRCLNRRHARAACTSCVDACPAHAIAFDGAPPQLDEHVCVRCGVCTVVCPTDSFIAVTDYEKTLRAAVANLEHEPTALVCAVHPNPTTTAANVTAVVQHRRCLAALTAADLLELNAWGRRPLARRQPVRDLSHRRSAGNSGAQRGCRAHPVARQRTATCYPAAQRTSACCRDPAAARAAA